MRSFGYNTRCGPLLDKMMEEQYRTSRRNCVETIVHYYLDMDVEDIPLPTDLELFSIPVERRYPFKLNERDEKRWEAYLDKLHTRGSVILMAVLIDMYLVRHYPELL